MKQFELTRKGSFGIKFSNAGPLHGDSNAWKLLGGPQGSDLASGQFVGANSFFGDELIMASARLCISAQLIRPCL